MHKMRKRRFVTYRTYKIKFIIIACACNVHNSDTKLNNILLAPRTGNVMADNVISPFMGHREIRSS